MLPPRRNRHHRGWAAPLWNLMDGIGYRWWKFKQFVARLFDFRWVTRQIGGFFEKLWWGVRYPFIVIGWLLQQAWSVMVAWWQIRNFRYLIQGLPALAGIIFILVVTAYTMLRADDGLQELYKRQALDARLRGDRQRAQLCYERLMQLQYVGDPSRLETQFNLGQLSLELQQYQRSRALLAELSNPDNDEGYTDAHIQKAQMIFQTSKRTKEDLDLMEKHLRRALKKQPENKRANGLLGILLWMRGRNDEAIPPLLKSDPQDVDARLTLAKIYKAQGNQAQANLYIDPLIDYLKTNAQGEIDDIRFRMTLARAYMQLDDFQSAIKVLTNAYAMRKSEFFRTELSNCYLQWYYKLFTLPQTPDRERLKLDCVINALEWDDRNIQALSAFVDFMKPTGNDSPERDRAHRVLTALKGNNAYLHLYLGHKLYSEGKTAEAEAEWSLAYKLNPNSPIIVNNFAWILTHGNTATRLQPDLIRAESLINQVIARTAPDDANKPKYHGTRGTVYMKMGRFEEARSDFMIAIQHRDAVNDIPLQQQLVEVHERLRMTSVADVYRKMLAETIKRNTRVDAEKAVQ